MKRLLTALMLLFAVVMAGCSNTTSTGPIGIGNVAFTTSVVQDQQMNSYFQFVPSTGVTLDSIVATCPQLQVNNEVVSGDGMTVFSATNPIQVGPVQGLAAAQQWTFIVAGKVGTPTGTNYSTTVNYTTQ